MKELNVVLAGNFQKPFMSVSTYMDIDFPKTSP